LAKGPVASHYSVDFVSTRFPKSRNGTASGDAGLWVSSHIDRTQYQIAPALPWQPVPGRSCAPVVVGTRRFARRSLAGRAGPNDPKREVRSRCGAYATCGSSGCASSSQSAWIRHHPHPAVLEDDPVAAQDAAGHVECIRQRVLEIFPRQGDRDRRSRLAERRPMPRVLYHHRHQAPHRHGLERGRRERSASTHRSIPTSLEAALRARRRPLGSGSNDGTRQQKFVWGLAGLEPSPLAVATAAASCWPAWYSRRLIVRGALAGVQAIGAGAWRAVALNAAVAGVLPDGPSRMCRLKPRRRRWVRSLSFRRAAIICTDCGPGLWFADRSAGFCRDHRAKRSARIRWLTLGSADRVDLLACSRRFALSFEPAATGFSFAPLTAAALPFLLLADRGARAGRRRSPKRSRLVSRCARFHHLERDGRQLEALCCRGAVLVAISCFGHGSRQAEDQEHYGERGQRRVVKHDAGTPRAAPAPRTPPMAEQIDAPRERHDAEHCGVNSGWRPAVAQSQFAPLPSQAMPTADCSITR